MPWRNLPNAITLGRIVLAVVVAPMVMTDSFSWRLAGFIVFLIAAFSDLWDGHLARSRNLISDFGKLMDPLADKLLLAATFVPFYILSHGDGRGSFPWFGGVLPWWIMAIIFGREIFITVFRGFAAKRGIVLAAGNAGKLKAVFQNVFIGSAIFWYALRSAAREYRWDTPFWRFWQQFHYGFTVVVLTVAVVLTVYSLYI
ncbi:MAG TPA: CDP-alcohol phosphatidyltransferase family protein, partial [Longimicrobium sp.]|uniref:CDP-alcohol phosphatidyltransferase family protein n=1 Tax=Longimicrobium sp. TaxID=2029185 RepID=UPI002EDA0E87